MYKNEKIFQFFANLILALLTICCVAPFLLMISASFSSESALSVYGYTFWPKEFDLSAYKYLFSSTGALLKAYSVSIFRSAIPSFSRSFCYFFTISCSFSIFCCTFAQK